MHSIVVNGETRIVGEESTVLDVVVLVTGRSIDTAGEPADGRPLGLAVARGGVIVPRAAWATTLVNARDEFDLVTAVQGG